jgi:hypothetical protein
MISTEKPQPPTILYDFGLKWGKDSSELADVAILPNFFEQAIGAFRRLMRDLESAGRGKATLPRFSRSSPTKPVVDLPPEVKYERQYQFKSSRLPMPNFKVLGEGTNDALNLIPKFTQAVDKLPVYSHRFVTLSLEEGMDM